MRAGNPPRTLKLADNNATSRVKAPPGLPRNCYDMQYLKSLKNHEVAALCIDDRIIDLSIPADIDACEV